jgi:hypothetical protein
MARNCRLFIKWLRGYQQPGCPSGNDSQKQHPRKKTSKTFPGAQSTGHALHYHFLQELGLAPPLKVRRSALNSAALRCGMTAEK